MRHSDRTSGGPFRVEGKEYRTELWRNGDLLVDVGRSANSLYPAASHRVGQNVQPCRERWMSDGGQLQMVHRPGLGGKSIYRM